MKVAQWHASDSFYVKLACFVLHMWLSLLVSFLLYILRPVLLLSYHGGEAIWRPSRIAPSQQPKQKRASSANRTVIRSKDLLPNPSWRQIIEEDYLSSNCASKAKLCYTALYLQARIFSRFNQDVMKERLAVNLLLCECNPSFRRCTGLAKFLARFREVVDCMSLKELAKLWSQLGVRELLYAHHALLISMNTMHKFRDGSGYLGVVAIANSSDIGQGWLKLRRMDEVAGDLMAWYIVSFIVREMKLDTAGTPVTTVEENHSQYRRLGADPIKTKGDLFKLLHLSYEFVDEIIWEAARESNFDPLMVCLDEGILRAYRYIFNHPKHQDLEKQLIEFRSKVSVNSIPILSTDPVLAWAVSMTESIDFRPALTFLDSKGKSHQGEVKGMLLYEDSPAMKDGHIFARGRAMCCDGKPRNPDSGLRKLKGCPRLHCELVSIGNIVY